MYGLINQAIQAHVESRYGAAAWRRGCAAAMLEEPAFLTLESYPDSVSYALVAAVAKETGLSPAVVLEDVGRLFTGFAASRGYEDLLRATGSSFAQFLTNLDLLHSHVGGAYPELRPPSFRVSELQDDCMRLHYYSTREGLASMVIGLLHGAAERFELTLEVVHDVRCGEGSDHDEFAVRFALRSGAAHADKTHP